MSYSKQVYRVVERGFAVVGVMTAVAVGVAAYGIYAYKKELKKFDGGLLGFTRPIGKKLPDSFVLHLDLDQTSIVDSTRSVGWESFFQQGRQSMTLRSVIKSLESASRDDRVQGFLATGCDGIKGLGMIQELRSAVVNFNRIGNKRFRSVFYADSFGEADNKTLAYYLASAFHHIYMQPTGQMTTVGFSIQTPFFRQLLDKYKIEPRVWSRERYKNVLNMFTHDSFTEEHREQLIHILTGIYNQVIEGISSGRGLDKAAVNDTIACSPLTGTEAVARGFIDSLCHRSDVMKLFINEKKPLPRVSIKDYFQIKEHEERKQKPKKIKQVLIVDASGTIVQGWTSSMPRKPAVCSGRFNQQLSEIAANSKIGAVVIRVDSNGGSAIASDAIRNQISELRQSGKCVVVSMGNMAASGGYYISLGADSIVANPGTLTGSIGVVSGSPYFVEFLKDWGINVATLNKGVNASVLSPFTKLTTEQETIVENLIDEFYKNFQQAVGEARGLNSEKVKEVSQGRVWLGVDAFHHGLVDALGGLSDAIDLAKRGAGLPDNAPVVESMSPYRYFEFIEGFLRQFIGGGNARMSEMSDIVEEVVVPSSLVQSYSFDSEVIHRSIS
eukprot:g9099.t1